MIARISTLALTVSALLCATTARADGEPQKEAPPEAPAPGESAPPVLRLYGEPIVAVPMGALASVTGPGVGALLAANYRLSDTWQLTGRAGYVAGSTTGIQVSGITVQSSLSYAPVLAGAKLYLAGSDVVRLYAAGEGGLLFVTNTASVDAEGVSAAASGTSTHVCGALSAGLELDVLDVSVGLLAADVAHTDTTTAGLFSLGFRFASL